MDAREIIKKYGNEKGVKQLIDDRREAFLCDLKKYIVNTIIDKLEYLYEDGFGNRYAIISDRDFSYFVEEKLSRDRFGGIINTDSLSYDEYDTFHKACRVEEETLGKLREFYDEFERTFFAYVFQLLIDFEAQLIVNKGDAKEAVYAFEAVWAEDASWQRIDAILFRIKDGYREMVDLLIKCFKPFAYNKLNEYCRKDGLK